MGSTFGMEMVKLLHCGIRGMHGQESSAFSLGDTNSESGYLGKKAFGRMS